MLANSTLSTGYLSLTSTTITWTFPRSSAWAALYPSSSRAAAVVCSALGESNVSSRSMPARRFGSEASSCARPPPTTKEDEDFWERRWQPGLPDPRLAPDLLRGGYRPLRGDGHAFSWPGCRAGADLGLGSFGRTWPPRSAPRRRGAPAPPSAPGGADPLGNLRAPRLRTFADRIARRPRGGVSPPRRRTRARGWGVCSGSGRNTPSRCDRPWRSGLNRTSSERLPLQRSRLKRSSRKPWRGLVVGYIRRALPTPRENPDAF